VPLNATTTDGLLADARWQLDHLGTDWATRPAEETYQVWAKDRRELIKRVGNIPTSHRENERLRELEGRYAGERIFVIGNGPSLNRTDLSLLKNEFTFAVNRFYLMYDKIDWRPTFFTCNDWEVAADNLAEIVDQVDSADSTIFWPTRFRGALPVSDRVYHYNTRNAESKTDAFALDITGGTVMGGTVLAPVLQLVQYMGFSPIYLIGTDVNYSVDTTVKQSGRLLENGVRQFLVSTEDDDNHFDPRYFGEGRRWHNPDPAAMRRGFAACGQAIEDAGGVLRNATVGGELEEVPRVDYNSLFLRISGALVSIVMPAYNAGPYIEETIRSVQGQTHQNWELIVVDDGSTDETAEKVEAVAQHDPRVKLLRQANAGKSAARNTGLDLASGEFITFLDADDSFLVRKLTIQVAMLERSPDVGVVVGGHVRTDESGRVVRARTRPDGAQIDLNDYLGGCPFLLKAALFRASTLATVRFDVQRKWAEDWEFLLRFAAEVEAPVVQHSEIVSRYRMTPQAVAKVNREFAEAHISVVDDGLHRVLDEQRWRKSYPRARREVGIRLAGRLAACGHTADAGAVLEQTEALSLDGEFDYRPALSRSVEFWNGQLAVAKTDKECKALVDEVMEWQPEIAL